MSVELSEIQPPLESRILSREEWASKAPALFEAAIATGKPIAVFQCDLVGFKDVNDTLGHPTGTVVIEDISGLIAAFTESLRLKDVDDKTRSRRDARRDTLGLPAPRRSRGINSEAARTGGDEFTIISEADEDAAEIIAQRLRDVVEDYNEGSAAAALREKNVKVGISIGWVIRQEGMSFDDLVDLADKAMYKNKFDNLPIVDDEHVLALFAISKLYETLGVRQRQIPGILQKAERDGRKPDVESIARLAAKLAELFARQRETETDSQ